MNKRDYRYIIFDPSSDTFLVHVSIAVKEKVRGSYTGTLITHETLWDDTPFSTELDFTDTKEHYEYRTMKAYIFESIEEIERSMKGSVLSQHVPSTKLVWAVIARVSGFIPEVKELDFTRYEVIKF